MVQADAAQLRADFITARRIGETVITKTPPNTYFLKRAAKIDKGSPTVGKGAPAGRVTMTQLREIAEIKMKDMNANDIDGAVRMLAGSARSMGLTVVEG